MVSFSASAVHAEVPICTALKPWLIGARSPLRRTGSAAGRGCNARVDQQRQLAVHQVGEVGHRGLQRVHRHRDVAAVEVPAVQHPPASRR
jgi:hypothetical protein